MVRLNISKDGAVELQRLGWLALGAERDPHAIGDAILAMTSAALGLRLRPRG